MKIHICENDKHGRKSGKASAIIFFDAQGDKMLELESINLQGEPLRSCLSDHHIICYGCQFKHNGTEWWVGNLMWNGYQVPDEHALGLINTLHQSRRWVISEAWVEIARAWQESGELTGDLFELHGVRPVSVNRAQMVLEFPKSA